MEEKLCENAARLGKVLREELEKIPKSKIVAIRGRGLMFAIDVHDSKHSVSVLYFFNRGINEEDVQFVAVVGCCYAGSIPTHNN